MNHAFPLSGPIHPTGHPIPLGGPIIDLNHPTGHPIPKMEHGNGVAAGVDVQANINPTNPSVTIQAPNTDFPGNPDITGTIDSQGNWQIQSTWHL